MAETSVLRSTASPKNASPHMAGGQNHTQLSSPKPMVQITMSNGGPIPPGQKDRNVTLSRSPNAPRRTMPIRASQQQQPQLQGEVPERAEVELLDDGAGNTNVRARGTDGVGIAAGAVKPMIVVSMQNGKPQVGKGNDRNPRSNVVILNRTNRPAPTQRQRRQLVEAPSSMTSQQLLLCRHVMAKFVEAGGDDQSVLDLAAQTVTALDGALILQSEIEQSAPAPIAPKQVVVTGARAPMGVNAPRRFSSQQPERRVVAPPTSPSILPPEPFESTIDDVASETPSRVIDVDDSPKAG